MPAGATSAEKPTKMICRQTHFPQTFMQVHPRAIEKGGKSLQLAPCRFRYLFGCVLSTFESCSTTTNLLFVSTLTSHIRQHGFTTVLPTSRSSCSCSQNSTARTPLLHDPQPRQSTNKQTSTFSLDQGSYADGVQDPNRQCYSPQESSAGAISRLMVSFYLSPRSQYSARVLQAQHPYTYLDRRRCRRNGRSSDVLGQRRYPARCE